MAKEKPVEKVEKPAKSVKSMSKGQFFSDLAEATELKKTDVAKLYEAMTNVILKELGAKGPGVFALPGLFKLKARRVKAIKGGKSVPNRFKPGEMTITKDKPAHTKVTARPLKGLKESLK